jgi:hypothetical protein
MTVYVCENPTCTAYRVGVPSFFTDGLTAEQAEVLFPDQGAPYGEGYCTTCGQKGKVHEKEVQWHVGGEE